MDVESRLDQALERGGQTVQPDVPAALLDVRRRAQRSMAKRRAGMAAAVAGVVLAAGLAARIGAPGADGSEDPVSPPRETGTSDAVSLTLVREATAESLGLRKLLSAAVAPTAASTSPTPPTASPS